MGVTEIKNLIDLAFYLIENDSEADINYLLDKEIRQLMSCIESKKVVEDDNPINNLEMQNETEKLFKSEKDFNLNRIINEYGGNKTEAIKMIRKDYPVSISKINNLLTIALQAKDKDPDVNLDELLEKDIKDFLDSVYVEERTILDLDAYEKPNFITDEIINNVDYEGGIAVEEKAEEFNFFYEILWGEVNLSLLCPHCQKKGHVRTKAITKKEGFSGGKVIAGVFTHGWSLLATGLAKKNKYIQAHCDSCNSTWTYN